MIVKERYGLNSNIDLIEMVPVYDYPEYYNDNYFEDFNLFNASIETNVSSFKMIYEWKNLNQIITNLLGEKNYNNISLHHQMPYLGSHMSLTIEWYFQD